MGQAGVVGGICLLIRMLILNLDRFFLFCLYMARDDLGRIDKSTPLHPRKIQIPPLLHLYDNPGRRPVREGRVFRGVSGGSV